MTKFLNICGTLLCILILAALVYAGTHPQPDVPQPHVTHSVIPDVKEVPQPSVDVLEDHSLVAAPTAWTPVGYSRLHDKGSGIEVLCFRGPTTSVSCVPTGRKWY